MASHFLASGGKKINSVSCLKIKCMQNWKIVCSRNVPVWTSLKLEICTSQLKYQSVWFWGFFWAGQTLPQRNLYNVKVTGTVVFFYNLAFWLFPSHHYLGSPEIPVTHFRKEYLHNYFVVVVCRRYALHCMPCIQDIFPQNFVCNIITLGYVLIEVCLTVI